MEDTKNPMTASLVEESPIIDMSITDTPMTESYFNTPIVIMPVLIILAGIFYGITFAFDSSQIRFILYCGTVWSICLAFIYYVNHSKNQTQTLLSSSAE